MKKSRKLISLLMALAMIFALAIPAFAATFNAGTGNGTINITDAVDGETYTAYKMLDLSYNTATGSHSYTVASGWEDFFKDTYVAKYFDVDDDGYVTCSLGDDADELATIAKMALAYATDTSNAISAAGSVVAANKEATIAGLDLGYYLVDTSLGTLCSIDSTDTIAEIVEKNSDEPTDTKTVSSDGETYDETNSASIGDTVYFKVELGNLANKSNVTLTDTMSAGLTLDTDSIEVYAGATAATVDSDYTVDATTSGYTIAFTDSYLATLSSSTVITVTYSATINGNAVIEGEGNTNEAKLGYGTDHTVSDTTITYVYGFDLKKVDDDGNDLSGAEFTLADSAENVITFVKVNSGYRVATKAEIKDAETETVTTIVAGSVNISGLDAGTYTLTETKAPTGYNLLKEPVTITINADGTVKYGDSEGTVSIENKAGSILPGTGGMGTTLFYIFGGAMVLCAVVLLVTRRRMDNEQ